MRPLPRERGATSPYPQGLASAQHNCIEALIKKLPWDSQSNKGIREHGSYAHHHAAHTLDHPNSAKRKLVKQYEEDKM